MGTQYCGDFWPVLCKVTIARLLSHLVGFVLRGMVGRLMGAAQKTSN